MWKTLLSSSSSFWVAIFPSAEENAAYFMMHESRQFKFKKKIVTICKNRNHFSLRTKLTLGTKTNRPPFSASWVIYHFCEIKCCPECEHFFLYTFFYYEFAYNESHSHMLTHWLATSKCVSKFVSLLIWYDA